MLGVTKLNVIVLDARVYQSNFRVAIHNLYSHGYSENLAADPILFMLSDISSESFVFSLDSDLSKRINPLIVSPFLGGGDSFAIDSAPLVIRTLALDVRTFSIVCAIFLASSVAVILSATSCLILILDDQRLDCIIYSMYFTQSTHLHIYTTLGSRGARLSFLVILGYFF